jgi:hypothetical protein
MENLTGHIRRAPAEMPPCAGNLAEKRRYPYGAATQRRRLEPLA